MKNNKYFLISLFLLFLSTAQVSFAQDKEQVILDILKTPSEDDLALMTRADQYALEGNLNKAIDYVSDVLKKNISNDFQALIINYSFKLAEYFIQNQEYDNASNILNDIQFRLKNYLKMKNPITKEWQNRLTANVLWIKILENQSHHHPSKSLIPDLRKLLQKEPDAKQIKNSSYSLMIVNYCLSLIYKENQMWRESLDFAYDSLALSNQTSSFYFYYLNCRSIIQIYLFQKDFKKAILRFNMLNKLFRTVKPSNFYKAKTLILLAQIYIKENKNKEALSILQRTYEMIWLNSTISQEQRTRFLETVANFMTSLKEKGVTTYEKNSFFLFKSLKKNNS